MTRRPRPILGYYGIDSLVGAPLTGLVLSEGYLELWFQDRSLRIFAATRVHLRDSAGIVHSNDAVASVFIDRTLDCVVFRSGNALLLKFCNGCIEVDRKQLPVGRPDSFHFRPGLGMPLQVYA